MKPIWMSSPENAPRQKGEKMRRAIVLVFLLALMLLALGAAPAFGQVHGVSQAGCAADTVVVVAAAGANLSSDNSPLGPIPVTASDSRTQGRGGAAGAEGIFCP